MGSFSFLTQLKPAALTAGITVFSVACSSTGTGTDVVEANPAPAASSGATAEQVATAESKAAIEDPRVCKRETQIGTKISKRVCKKQSEWDAIEGAGSQMTAEIQRRATQAGNPTGN